MMAFLVLSWASAIMLTRVAVTDLSPLWVTSGRLVTGAIVLILYRTLFVKARWSLRWHHAPWVLWLALLSSAIPFFLIAWGTQYASSAIAGILMGTIPLSVLGFAHLFLPDEKFSKNKAVGFMIGFVGLLLIIKPGAETIAAEHRMELIGILAIFIASLCYALNSVVTRKMPAASNVDKATAVVTTAAILLLLMTLSLEPASSISSAPIMSWIILTYLGVVPTASASLVLFVLLSQTTASFVAMNNYIIPVCTAFGGVFFLGETLPINAWLGMVVILLGLAISERRPKIKNASGQAT